MHHKEKSKIANGDSNGMDHGYLSPSAGDIAQIRIDYDLITTADVKDMNPGRLKDVDGDYQRIFGLHIHLPGDEILS